MTMRVLHLINALDWCGGIETYVLNLLPRLEAHGITPLLAVARRGSATVSTQTWHIPALSNRDPALEPTGRGRMRELLQAARPDIVHTHNVFNLGALDECLATCPTVYTTHGYQFACPAEDFYQGRTATICNRTCGPACFLVTLGARCMSLRPRHALTSYRRVRWAQRNANQFSMIIAPCRHAADRHVAAGFSSDRVQVLPYFCPVEPLTVPRVGPTIRTITFIGRIRPYKGYDYFVRLLSRLPSDVHGVMIGDFSSATRQSVMSLAKRVDCAERLRLSSWVARDEIRSVFEATTVFVFPSVWPETLGIVGLESLAHGVPVVAFDVGGVREWLDSGRTGELANVKNIDQLVEVTSRLLDNPEHARQLGVNGLKLMREKFSPERHVASLISIYAVAASCPIRWHPTVAEVNAAI